MDARTRDILLAAKTLFARYGFSKTTMSEIAAEARVARQTVYNAFPGKTEILRAVVQMAGEEIADALQAAWADLDGVEAKLTAFQQLGPVTWYDLMHTSPNWADLFEGMHAEAAEEMAELNSNLSRALEDMLRQAGATCKNAELGDVVEFFFAASLNAKYGAEDRAHLERRLAVILMATLGLLTLPEPA